MAQPISKMETTQTAVQWLQNELLRLEMLDGYAMFEIFEKAKEMEKERIMNALPTDEDIDNYIDNLKGWGLIEKDFFRSGAKFMRNIIKNNDGKKMCQL